MGYYIQEYRDGHIGVEQLVMALFELFNTHAKVEKFTSVFTLLFRKSSSVDHVWNNNLPQFNSLTVLLSTLFLDFFFLDVLSYLVIFTKITIISN